MTILPLPGMRRARPAARTPRMRSTHGWSRKINALSGLTPLPLCHIPARASGDELQGAAADCNSAGETHAWFDSRVAHQIP